MLLFASTILLSAFLLFLVQPIIAKQILPWFGGTSAVWTVCLVFFQVLLLLGYTYSHVITRHLAPRQQMRLHIALLLVSLLFLPIIPNAAFKPAAETDAAFRILLLLMATIGLPYFLLSTTGPLLQKWVAPRFPEKSVYRLFALSNFGSLIGLLAFPFAIEPFATSRAQSLVWSGAYALFVLACALSAWKSGQAPAAPHVVDTSAPAADTAIGAAPSGRDYAMWLAFSALGSVMLLASTSHITQNIASVPFLWVLPLSLYLLTFVLAFEGRGGRGWYERWMMFVMLLFVVGMAAGLSAGRGVLDVSLAVPLYSVGMFMAVFFCNGELALRKPTPRYLTQFYLTISLGGALGGLFVGLIAPRLFPTTYELPLALMALAALALVVVWNNKFLIGPALVASLATAWYGSEYFTFLGDDVIYMHRNFYGTLRVREQGAGDHQVRRLLHGVILHGEQSTIAPDRLEPGTYHARTSGAGRAIESRQADGPVRLGVVGLGVGTLSAYGRAGDTVRFYELDPDVLALARNYFTYLNASPSTLEFVIGDARLSLERELARGAPQGYDVLAIDAFSSDSIPVHLITREAIDLFVQHVAPEGILAIHISNRFLDLKPVLANIAHSLGLTIRLVSDSPTGRGSASMTDWVLITRTDAAFAHELLDVAQPIEPNPALSLWTDQFNNLIDVLKSSPVAEFRRLVGVE
ncbi:MAG TPA: fused MFS/spermidine synthase [Burkholderiaceae bacterium]|nr:fused MFS/spermidine synthase [Burkholderiaceae bacterium]